MRYRGTEGHSARFGLFGRVLAVLIFGLLVMFGLTVRRLAGQEVVPGDTVTVILKIVVPVPEPEPPPEPPPPDPEPPPVPPDDSLPQPPPPEPDTATLPAALVAWFDITGPTVVPGAEIPALDSGTLAIEYNATNGCLFSRDHNGFGAGGHITICLRNGALWIRIQDTVRSVVATAPNATGTHRIAYRWAHGSPSFLTVDGLNVSMGDAMLWTMAGNTFGAILGGSCMTCLPPATAPVTEPLQGTISQLRIYDFTFDSAQASAWTRGGTAMRDPAIELAWLRVQPNAGVHEVTGKPPSFRGLVQLNLAPSTGRIFSFFLDGEWIINADTYNRTALARTEARWPCWLEPPYQAPSRGYPECYFNVTPYALFTMTGVAPGSHAVRVDLLDGWPNGKVIDSLSRSIVMGDWP